MIPRRDGRALFQKPLLRLCGWTCLVTLLGSLSPARAAEKVYELVFSGGGPSALMAAILAARNGAGEQVDSQGNGGILMVEKRAANPFLHGRAGRQIVFRGRGLDNLAATGYPFRNGETVTYVRKLETRGSSPEGFENSGTPSGIHHYDEYVPDENRATYEIVDLLDDDARGIIPIEVLQHELLQIAKKIPNLSLAFQTEVTDVKAGEDLVTIQVKTSDGKDQRAHGKKLVIADGGQSVLPGRLGVRYFESHFRPRIMIGGFFDTTDWSGTLLRVDGGYGIDEKQGSGFTRSYRFGTHHGTGILADVSEDVKFISFLDTAAWVGKAASSLDVKGRLVGSPFQVEVKLASTSDGMPHKHVVLVGDAWRIHLPSWSGTGTNGASVDAHTLGHFYDGFIRNRPEETREMVSILKHTNDQLQNQAAFEFEQSIAKPNLFVPKKKRWPHR